MMSQIFQICLAVVVIFKMNVIKNSLDHDLNVTETALLLLENRSNSQNCSILRR